MKSSLSLLDLGSVELVPAGALSASPSLATADDLTPEGLPDDFVQQAMNRAYDPDLNMVRDVRYDDSSLVAAANIYDFCANVVGTKIKMPYARQLWMLMHVFGEYCPRCSHPEIGNIETVPVDADPHEIIGKGKMQPLSFGKCLSCGTTKFQLVVSGELQDNTEFVAAIGQRAGKSTIVAIASCYVVHKYCKGPKLSSVAHGIQDFTPLTGTFVALTSTNAIKLLWKPFREMIVASSWFEEYFSLLKRLGDQYGRELYQFNVTGNYLRIFTKGLDMYPEGPNKRTLRGPTRFLSAVDELSHFPYNPMAEGTEADEAEDDQRERANGDEVVTVLNNSMTTVQGEVYRLYKNNVYAYPQAINFLTSSPASWQDKLMRMYQDAPNSTTRFAVRAATWDISPHYTRDHPNIVNLYRTNPRKAERDFGANPPKLDSTVFGKAQIQDMFCLDQTHRIIYHNIADFTRGKVTAVNRPARAPASIMSLDAGLTNNAFAVTVQYKSKDGTIKVPVALEIVAVKGTKIDFKYVYENVLHPLIKDLNVRELYADRWNSEYILRQAEADFPLQLEIAKNYSLRSRDFDAFIDFVPTGQLLLPKSEIDFDDAEGVIDFKRDLLQYPGAHLYRQFLTVQQIAGMLVKGNGSTDDIFRALVLGVTRLFDAKVLERMSKHVDKAREALPMEAIIVIGGRSSIGYNAMLTRQQLLYGHLTPQVYKADPEGDS